ncbi:Hypp9323 [Branchiostoma lanceolatum]|uniref:Hypp9323 protein n=1 Tax=Branchiostoma lanceolatum TaxID=7740 RepID=A0A8S4MMQ7_BRALA|nr:Hypp9323 [Branchiostoma lanceolatum]
MKGGDTVSSEEFPLFKGTAKSAEGVGLEMLWAEAVHDGISPEVHWQDGDSSSAKSFRAHFPDEEKHKVMLCSGHVARAHQKVLSDIKVKKSVTKAYQTKHQDTFPAVKTAKCVCAGKNHGKGCGCISDAFIRQARINFFCCVVQADKDPAALKARLLSLGKHHGRDIHSWKDPSTKKKAKCDFHPAKTCACPKCKNKTKGREPLCGKGKLYKSKTAVTCPLHSLMYEIETATRAEKADRIIHPELGRGNSNLPEASHNVLLRLRSKDVFLSRLHYIVKTDMGLLQSCVTWEQETKPFGQNFIHWRVELFERMKLPIPPGMVRNIQQALRERKTDLEGAKTDEGKGRRIALKTARVLDSEERKQWVKKRAIQHSYGEAELDADSDDEANSGLNSHPEKQNNIPEREGAVSALIDLQLGITAAQKNHHHTTAWKYSQRGEDERRRVQASIWMSVSTCRNTPGSYLCDCGSGFGFFEGNCTDVI